MSATRRYRVEYTVTGFDTRWSDPFNTFEEARTWARKHCSGWWTICNYYG